MAKVKGVIPETVKPDGYAVLNADDDLVFDMANKVDCNFALFSMDENNPRIKRQFNRGGISAIYENGYITICKGEWKMRVSKAANVPLTMGGKAKFMIQNVLAAVLATYLDGLRLKISKLRLNPLFLPHPKHLED